MPYEYLDVFCSRLSVLSVLKKKRDRRAIGYDACLVSVARLYIASFVGLCMLARDSKPAIARKWSLRASTRPISLSMDSSAQLCV